MSTSAASAYQTGLAALVDRGAKVPSVLGPLSKASNFGIGDRPWREIIGYTFTMENSVPIILNPVELPTHVPYCLGLLAWTLAGRNDVASLEYYRRGAREFTDDGETLCGAFGGRLFGIGHSYDQLAAILDRVRSDPTSRRTFAAVISPDDNLDEPREFPCAAGVQLFLRDGALQFMTIMRAQQALTVLPYDLFLFSSLHHFLASALGVRVGYYHHFAGTFHVYDAELPTVRGIASSSSLRAVELPQIPPGRADAVQRELIEIEESCRLAAIKGESDAIRSIAATTTSFKYNATALDILANFAMTKIRVSG
jgi:thymidylate synthase